MAKRYQQPGSVAAQEVPVQVLPVPGLVEKLEPTKEDRLRDGWEQRDGAWINRRDFRISGGVVPQGVVRSTQDAYDLEVQRCG